MALIAEYRFDDTAGSGTFTDSVGTFDGVFKDNATTDGAGAGTFDGAGDYGVIAAAPELGLSEGTIALSFTQDTASVGNTPSGASAAQTLFSVDSRNLDGGGHLTIYVTSSGTVTVRHQTATTEYYYSGGSVTLGQPTDVSYSFGPAGSVLEVNGVVVATGTVPLSMAGDVEPIVIGASQTRSSDGGADNLSGFFDGTIDYVSINNAATAVPPPACFMAGTRILAPGGWRPVEQLRRGDLVMTADAGPQPVRAVISRHVSETELTNIPSVRPIVFRKGRLGNTRDLWLSRQHCVLMIAEGEEVLVRAAHLERFCGRGVRRANGRREVQYLHLDLPHHHLVYAEGALCETRLPRLADRSGAQARACRPILSGAQVRHLVAAGALHPPGAKQQIDHRALSRLA